MNLVYRNEVYGTYDRKKLHPHIKDYFDLWFLCKNEKKKKKTVIKTESEMKGKLTKIASEDREKKKKRWKQKLYGVLINSNWDKKRKKKTRKTQKLVKNG